MLCTQVKNRIKKIFSGLFISPVILFHNKPLSVPETGLRSCDYFAYKICYLFVNGRLWRKFVMGIISTESLNWPLVAKSYITSQKVLQNTFSSYPCSLLLSLPCKCIQTDPL